MDKIFPDRDRKADDDIRHWHSYGLQRLSLSRFTDVVDEILSHRSILISPRSQQENPEISAVSRRRSNLAQMI